MEKTVEHIAKLAHMELTRKEVKALAEDISSILKHFSELEEIKADKTITYTFDGYSKLREDVPENSLSQKEALANTKNRKKGFFKGPRIL